MAAKPLDPSLSPEKAKEVKRKVDSESDKASLGAGNSAVSVGDRVELSPEAKGPHDLQIQNKLTEIRGKIDNGFYNSDEVLYAVAGSLVKVILAK